MERVAIIADDLTGAADSGVQLAKRGLATVVVLDAQGVESTADALVVDTESRALPAAEAYERVAEAARGLRDVGYSRLYKKLDSTLRGNVGAELDAAMDVLGLELGAVAPAFPANARTTIGGYQLLHGAPISHAEPRGGPDIVALLGAQSRRPAGLVELRTVRAGQEAIRARVSELSERGARLLVFDAVTDADLRAVASALLGLEPRLLWAGSAGLAAALADAWGLPERGTTAAVTPEPVDGPILLVAGSCAAVARVQVDRFRSGRGAAAVELDPAALLAGDADEPARCACRLAAAFERGQDAALTLTRYEEPGGGCRPDAAHRLADALGEVAATAAQACALGGLILTGGDTARAVCSRLGVTGIRLLDELEPGVALGELPGFRNLPMITKAGGFGHPDTLLNASRTLRRWG